jgi:DNA-binding transcriptional regulator YdaS (Cro superfamily)
MGNNAAVDVAIALVLMYLLISIMVTVVNEMLTTVMKLRASTLKSALEGNIDNPSLRADFYNHGLIAGTDDALKGQHVS